MVVATDPTSGGPSASASSAAGSRPVDRSGRVLGGLLGALVSLAVAGVGLVVRAPSDGGIRFDIDRLVGLGLLGVPVGFVLGYAACNAVRSTGWRGALGIGVGIGFVAPPLGAIEILLIAGISAALDIARTGAPTVSLVAPLLLLVYAVAFSFIAVVVTIPAGIAWALAVRGLSERAFAAARIGRRLRPA